MNLLLLREGEIVGNVTELTDRRAAHLIRVLRVTEGSLLRTGVMGRGRATAVVEKLSGSMIRLRLGDLEAMTPPKTRVILCLPRPKVMSRCLQLIASFGVNHVSLINAWRVEKSYFSSKRLTFAQITDELILGCEQGGQVWVPELALAPNFCQFLEETEPRLNEKFPGPRLVLEPHCRNNMSSALEHTNSQDFVTLVIGPEGGFIDKELESFDRSDFRKVDLQTGTLKTEAALPAALGQLALIRALTNG